MCFVSFLSPPGALPTLYLPSAVGVEHLKSINRQREEEGPEEQNGKDTHARQPTAQLLGSFSSLFLPSCVFPVRFRLLGFVILVWAGDHQ